MNWVLPKYIANVLGDNYQVQMYNITHKNIPVNAIKKQRSY